MLTTKETWVEVIGNKHNRRHNFQYSSPLGQQQHFELFKTQPTISVGQDAKESIFLLDSLASIIAQLPGIEGKKWNLVGHGTSGTVYKGLAHANVCWYTIKVILSDNLKHIPTGNCQLMEDISILEDSAQQYLSTEAGVLPSVRYHPPVVKVADFRLARIICDKEVLKTFCSTPLYLTPKILAWKRQKGYSHLVDSFDWDALDALGPSKLEPYFSFRGFWHFLPTGPIVSSPIQQSERIMKQMQQLKQHPVSKPWHKHTPISLLTPAPSFWPLPKHILQLEVPEWVDEVIMYIEAVNGGQTLPTCDS
ncbi:hypothetical protein CONPUDRAFT_73873 [Coniophora puteana RWD-64-598 SS2]|uniref:Protein kinase domain-containing protein n=1 Tax=Coniophora puteana (strain RWD-64-598) TaxID=741705 RepID=A0A5M3MNW6_CONPW|nr:uncharacterized protein CONPUDRAFT_73873 [Coniophora puteana RWD-64-598 SS2]EIW80859.1 hypothetical protein CONPUDRAFT_73873 [Coniophora puteana RWD-64-598 SS2]